MDTYLTLSDQQLWLRKLSAYHMTLSPPSMPRPSIGRRISDTINNNPIPALILTTAIVSAVLFGWLNQATGNLNAAAARIDKMTSDVGEIRGILTGMAREVSKIENIGVTLVELRNFNSAIDQHLRSSKSFPAQIIERLHNNPGIQNDEAAN